jgi:gas vesicle protein
MGNSKFLNGLIIGAVTGAAIAIFLNSETGKEIMADIKDAAGKAIDELKETAKNFGEETRTATEKEYA